MCRLVPLGYVNACFGAGEILLEVRPQRPLQGQALRLFRCSLRAYCCIGMLLYCYDDMCYLSLMHIDCICLCHLYVFLCSGPRFAPSGLPQKSGADPRMLPLSSVRNIYTIMISCDMVLF